MKFKKIIVLAILLLILFVSMGMATANENTTITGAELNAEDNLMDYDYNAVIVDTTKYEDASTGNHVLDYDDQLLTFRVKDEYGYTDDAYVCMKENGKKHKVWWDPDDNDYWIEYKLPVGQHEITVYLDDSYYTAKPLVYNVSVEKSYFIGDVICKSYYGTSGSSLTMKATVKDLFGHREDGTIIFKVNGKSYVVKTKNGVATKTIKIKKAGTYTYSATFKSENYKDHDVGKAKLYVYSTSKKARTFKVKGYRIVVPLAKYKKLVNAKNMGKWICYQIKTNKYFKQKVRYYKTSYKWKYMGKVTPETAHIKGWKTKNLVKHWISDGEYYYTCDAYKKVTLTKVFYKTVKAKVSIVISYGGKSGGQTAPPNRYYVYLTTPYQNPGWDYCSPWLYGAKKSVVINKLNKAKTTRW